MKVIDIGTKQGASIITFLHKVKTFFPSYDEPLVTSDCVGVELDEDFEHDITGQEIFFMCGDILDPTFRATLPEPDFFLVCNVLHHLPDRNAIEELLGYVLATARYGVWFRLKSFETDDESGEGILLKHGLRFSWSENYTPYYCSEVFQFIRERFPQASIRIEPGKRIRHTNDKRVVPRDAVSSSFYYEPTMGVKSHTSLDKAVVCDWDVFIEKG